MHNTCRAIIDLAALRHNLQQAKSLAPSSKVMAVIKADAYGHGLVPIAKTLGPYADGLAVARLKEALDLRNNGISNRLLLLGSLIDTEGMQSCAEQAIDIVIHSPETIRQLCEATLDKPINIWLKVDVGMHRLGLTPEQLLHNYRQLSDSPNVADIVLMSHFSSADDEDSAITIDQLTSFDDLTRVFENNKSAANSAAILTMPHSHFDWVRPGIMLYGANPLPSPCSTRLKPVMTLKAKIVALREIPAEEGVGYNHRWKSQKPTTLATVGIGYGDGYPRHAHDGTPVLVNGHKAPLAGRVSMDLITVDVSECSSVNIGDEVTLWGEGLAAEEVAKHSDTISYQLFTSVSDRVCKEYINAKL